MSVWFSLSTYLVKDNFYLSHANEQSADSVKATATTAVAAISTLLNKLFSTALCLSHMHWTLYENLVHWFQINKPTYFWIIIFKFYFCSPSFLNALLLT